MSEKKKGKVVGKVYKKTYIGLDSDMKHGSNVCREGNDRKALNKLNK